MTSPTAPPESHPGKGAQKLLAGVALALGAALICAVFFSQRGIYQIYRFRHERLRLEHENARLMAENTRLARTIDRLQHDPEFIQDLIRRELNFVKKNEIIFQLPPGVGGKAKVPGPTLEAKKATAASPHGGGGDEADAPRGIWEVLGGPKFGPPKADRPAAAGD
jgi:cell division protein FtsB